MNKLALSALQVQQLACGSRLVECVDPAGKLVGFLHVADRNDQVHGPEITADQLEAYAQEPGGRSLSEILTDLRKPQ